MEIDGARKKNGGKGDCKDAPHSGSAGSGNGPRGHTRVRKICIFGFNLIQVKKHLFVIRMSYLETLTKLLTQIIQRLAYLFICHLVWCVADPKVQQKVKSKCCNPGVDDTPDKTVVSVWVTFRRNRNSCRRLFALCLGSEPAEFPCGFHPFVMAQINNDVLVILKF